MMVQMLYVALGGAIGAMLRFACMNMIGLTHFPFGTLLVNVLGSFLLGTLLKLSALHISLTEPLRLALVVGALGAFTTFSTFSMDAMYLLEKGAFLKLSLYVSASVILSLGAFYIGTTIVK
jgi:CrcB protein